MVADLSKCRILIVDAAPDDRLVLSNLLEPLGIGSIKECIDSEGARSELQKEGFDLVLCDWGSANTGGLALLLFLRQEGLHPETPFIMITADSNSHHITEAMQAGANDYILKPFETKQVQKKISKTLTRACELGPEHNSKEIEP